MPPKVSYSKMFPRDRFPSVQLSVRIPVPIYERLREARIEASRATGRTVSQNMMICGLLNAGLDVVGGDVPQGALEVD